MKVDKQLDSVCMRLNKHDFRLPKKEILKKSADFQTILEHGKRWEGEIVKYYYNKADEKKIGFIVPKRLGKAVFRNRIKRLMREVYRHHRQALGNYCICMMAKRTERPPQYQEIESEFYRFTIQCGLDYSRCGSSLPDS
jgi:ribonuclease P protein component